jgi:Sec-independent protein secretion pathway component TatC
MHNTNPGLTGAESRTYALFGSGAMVVSAVGLAFVVALWFTSMLFFVRGFVDGATTQAMTAEPGYESVVQ